MSQRDTNETRRFSGWSPIDNYRQGRKIGEGTFGLVSRATAKDGREVALKKIMIPKPKGQEADGVK
jgi:serine/threonine protein kinase